MKFFLTSIALTLFVYGCSSTVVKNEDNVQEEQSSIVVDAKKIAQSKFIEGSIAETKGEIEDAIRYYYEAAQLDPQPGIFYSLAKNYYRINKLSSALGYSQKSVKEDPTNKEYLFLLASIYSASRLEDSAIVVYEKIINTDSTDATAYFQLAQLYEKNRPVRSKSLYRKVIDLIGPEWNVLIRLIDLNERMGNIEETVQTIEELISLNPSDLRLQKLLIETYLKSGKAEKAEKLTDEAIASFPNDIDLLEMRGKSFLQKENWQGAFNIYNKLVENKEITYENKLRIGTIFLAAAEKDSNNLFLAKKIFERLADDSLDWQVNAYLGEIEFRQKNDTAAISYLTKAANLAEWNAQLWVRLGGILFDSRKYSSAISTMKNAVEKFPNDFAINLIYGLSLSQENEHTSAKTYLERAIKINPSDITALTALGFTLNQLKESDEALKYLNKALLLNPQDVQTIGMTALIYDSKKEFIISDSLYNEAMKIDSNNVLILNNYAYSLAERKVRLEDALSMSKKAVEKEPNSASYLDTIGWIYFQLGDYEKAKINIEKAIELDSKNGTLMDHLGDVYFKYGNVSEAMKLWKEAYEIDPTIENLKLKIEKGTL
ncbi:MAG: tetratricopeptide repeat protein [Bacteroidota bacterium]